MVELHQWAERERRRRERKRYERAELALQYAMIAEQSNSPTKDLAGKLGYKPEVMAQLVKALRAEGFLTQTVKGRAGGRITEQTANILGIEWVPESQDPPFKIDVKLAAQTKKDLVYQLRQLIRDVEAM
jgi:DNA-binding IscR family transcriptional regulator